MVPLAGVSRWDRDGRQFVSDPESESSFKSGILPIVHIIPRGVAQLAGVSRWDRDGRQFVQTKKVFFKIYRGVAQLASVSRWESGWSSVRPNQESVL